MANEKQITLYGSDNQPLQRSIENPAVSLSDADEWAEAFGDGFQSSSGLRITKDVALTNAAWWRGVNLVSSGVAKVPLFVQRRVGDRGKERASDHPAYRLLRYKPNRYMTAFTFKQTLTAHALADGGNGYAYIDRDGAGNPRELLPLDPRKTFPIRRNGELFYVLSIGGEVAADGSLASLGSPKLMAATDVIHIKGLGYNGLLAYDVIAYAKQTLGLDCAATEYNARYFANSAEPSVVFEHPGIIKPEFMKQLREQWEQLHKGVGKSHRMAILSQGMKLNPFSQSARDAQLNELRKLGIKMIANFIGVPPHKLGDDSKSSYNSLEQENQSMIDDCFDTWFVAWEEECYDKLLTEKEKASDTHLIEFQRQALVRADIAARGAYYDKAYNRWLSRNDIRGLENENPVEGGDEFGPEPGAPKPDTANPPDANQRTDDPVKPDTSDDDANKAMLGVLSDAMSRALGRIEKQTIAATKRPDTFSRTVADLQEKNDSVMRALMAPSVALFAHTPDAAKAMTDSLISSMFGDVRSKMAETRRTANEADMNAAVSREFRSMASSNLAGWIESARRIIKG